MSFNILSRIIRINCGRTLEGLFALVWVGSVYFWNRSFSCPLSLCFDLTGPVFRAHRLAYFWMKLSQKMCSRIPFILLTSIKWEVKHVSFTVLPLLLRGLGWSALCCIFRSQELHAVMGCLV